MFINPMTARKYSGLEPINFMLTNTYLGVRNCNHLRRFDGYYSQCIPIDST